MMAQQQHSGSYHQSYGTAVSEDKEPISATPAFNNGPARSPMSTTLQFTTVLPVRVADPCAVLMDSLEQQFFEWFDDFAPIDVDLTAWNGLAELSKSAPHPFLSGLAAGKLAERITISHITGRRPADFDGSFRAEFLSTTMAIEIEAANPDWFDACSNLDCDVGATAAEVKALVNTAPHPYFAGALYGRMAARLEYRMITGR